MRSGTVGAVLFLAGLLPVVGNAQVYSPAGAPALAAGAAGWQLRGEPIVYADAVYSASGPTVFFDPNVMVRTGEYGGVPLYSDTTLEPDSVVYVPVGGNLMRPYERRRAGELTGTEGSRAPSFPVETDAEAAIAARAIEPQLPPREGVDDEPAGAAVPVGTSGSAAMSRPSSAARSTIVDLSPTRTRPGIVESIPQPRSNGGIWLDYAGARWQVDGGGVAFAPGRFVRIGDYHGFPVYRARTGPADVIYIPSVQGGALAVYRRAKG